MQFLGHEIDRGAAARSGGGVEDRVLPEELGHAVPPIAGFKRGGVSIGEIRGVDIVGVGWREEVMGEKDGNENGMKTYPTSR